MTSKEPRRGLQRALLARRVELGGSEAVRVVLLRAAVRDDGGLGSHRGRELDRHVAQPAHAHDGDPLPRTGAEAPQRRVGRDPRAQQGCGRLEGDLVRDPAGEVLTDGEALRVAAGGRAAVGVVAVGPQGARQPAGRPGAELLLAGPAHLALAAGVDHAAHADLVTDLEAGDRVSDPGDDAGDLVAGRERELRRAPLLAAGVDVGVADPGVLDVEVDVVRSGLGDRDRRAVELGGRRRRRRPGPRASGVLLGSAPQDVERWGQYSARRSRVRGSRRRWVRLVGAVPVQRSMTETGSPPARRSSMASGSASAVVRRSSRSVTVPKR